MTTLPPCPSTPQWMHCDVLACQVLEEASREISANCKALGDALQGVCHDALERLPAEDGDDKISGTEFISTFSHFSTALLAVAGDLEIIVSQPLQRVIATMLEESNGRAKHLQQVKKRFSELQDKYGKAQQKTMEAKSKLAGDRRWWRKSSKSAVDQHAAVCDLARCEEELLESEASLRKLEDESRERLAQLDMDKRAMLQQVLQQGRSSLRRLLRVADEVPPLEDFQGVMPGADSADYFACLKEEPHESPNDDINGTGHDMPLEMERKDSLTDRFAKYLPGPDLEEECEVDVEVSASSRAAGWSPESTSKRLGARQGPQGSLVFESDASKVLIKTRAQLPERHGSAPGAAPVAEVAAESETEEDQDQEDAAEDQEDLAAAAQSPMTLELSPLVSEHPQQSFDAYVKRVPEVLAAAVETNWEKLQVAAADHPLGSLVGKLELFWIHEPGSVKPESAVGLVCFQFVQGYASHYVRILHLSVTKSEALQAAVSQARSFILETLPVKSLRVTVLAAEDEAQHICIDPQVELAYHQCGFRWFQLTQKLRRKKAALLRRKKKTLRFLVLHSQRTEEDPPAPRNEIGTKALLLLQSQTSEEPAAKESPTADQSPGDDLTFSSW